METMTKVAARRLIRQRRQLATLDVTCAVSMKLLAQVCGIAAWRQARCPCIYISLANEAPTQALLDACFANGTKVVVPRVNGDMLALHEIARETELIPGQFGILEPAKDAPLCSPSEVDCVIVPGVAFDGTGARLGYGKGFYDKLLAPIPQTPRIGLAFDWQILPSVPLESHDLRMHWVVTPTTCFAVG